MSVKEVEVCSCLCCFIWCVCGLTISALVVLWDKGYQLEETSTGSVVFFIEFFSDIF